jgi:hypothetical protein
MPAGCCAWSTWRRMTSPACTWCAPHPQPHSHAAAAQSANQQGLHKLGAVLDQPQPHSTQLRRRCRKRSGWHAGSSSCMATPWQAPACVLGPTQRPASYCMCTRRRQRARSAVLRSTFVLCLVCICPNVPAQVFEYLTTDLKKYMDRNGKGPNFPLPKTTIKVGCCEQQHGRCAGHPCVCAGQQPRVGRTAAAPHPRPAKLHGHGCPRQGRADMPCWRSPAIISRPACLC